MLLSLQPTVAFLRGHPNAFPILLVTCFFGCSGVGWLVALVWAFTNPARPTVVVRDRPQDEDDDGNDRPQRGR